MDRVLLVTTTLLVGLLFISLGSISGNVTKSSVSFASYLSWEEEGKITTISCDEGNTTERGFITTTFEKDNGRTYYTLWHNRCVQSGKEEYFCENNTPQVVVKHCTCGRGACQNAFIPTVTS